MEGYVYVLSNECMPGVYKIGCTTKTVQVRINELSSPTNMPVPFKEEMSFYVFDVAKAERLMHEELKDYRISQNKEFFRVELEVIGKASKCLFDDYISLLKRIADDVNYTGENYYEERFLTLLEPNFERLKEVNFKLEWFKDIFRKEDNYYHAICYTKLCTEAQYQEWVKGKCQQANGVGLRSEEIHNQEAKSAEL